MPFGLMPSDTGGSKFAANIADNAGVNQAAPTAGVNRRTQNAEIVSDASVYLTTTGGAGETIGATADAAVVGNTAGTLSAKARGLNTTLGTTTDAAVYDDVADATVQARLRGAVDHLGGLIATTGTTADAAVSTDANGTLSAKLRGLIVLMVNLLTRWPAALTAGGNLKAALLEAIPAGTNNIGDIDVLTLPNVTIGAAIPAGTNNIGDVDVLTLPNVTIGAALPAGTNNIGDVDVLSMPAVTVTGVALDATLAAQSAKLPATLGQKAMTASMAVVLASDQSVISTSQARSATGTDGAAVAVSTTAAAIIAANANRKKVSISNNGGSRFWLGSDAGMTAGQTGNNFGYLDPGDVLDETFYTGGIWGRTEAGTGYAAPMEVA